ncbi:chromatin-remodeling complex subunit Ies6p [Diutina catenulata]
MDLADKSEITTKHHSFKNPDRPPLIRRFKACRQLLSDEQKYLSKKQLHFDTPTYMSIAAPPSLKPQKRYCDITGLAGVYTSPTNRLRYHNVEIYTEVVKNMSTSVDQEYLELRGANVVLK